MLLLGAPMSPGAVAVGAGTHKSGGSVSSLTPAAFTPAARRSPDTSVETPRASVPLSARGSSVPTGKAEDGFGPSSCHLCSSGADTELSTRALAGSQGA